MADRAPDDDPALTPELRSILQAKLRWPLWVTLLCAAGLGGAALWARSLLSP